ncbi:MAG: nucleoside-diphosphate kinase [Elusimicrobia bacterium]|nr:nucleoside-diphosphate kinase [Elusimicrobiota bacterium]
MNFEKTLVIVKPDSFSNRNIGKVISEFEVENLRVIGAKMLLLNEEEASEFYAEHLGKPFWEPLLDFMTSNPILVLAISGENAIVRSRQLIGKTNPAIADPGTIRRKYASDNRHNAVHGSDSPESAKRELEFFFPDGEGIFSWEDKEYFL